MRIVHISFGGPIRHIMAKGKLYTFEMHHYCGPIPCKANGDPLATQPGPRSPFWEAVTLWSQQGERIGDNGLCIWDYPPQPITEHLGGRHYRVIGYTAATPGGE